MNMFYSKRPTSCCKNIESNRNKSKSFQICLILYVFSSQLVFGDKDICDQFSQKAVHTGRLARGGYILCPDRCACSQLKDRLIVDCERTNYTKIPTGIPKDVTELDLSRNSIRELPANSFDRLTSIKELTLRLNNITKLHVNAFAGLIHLNLLVLSENQFLSDGLVDYVFSSLGSLVKLKLSQCGLKSINIKAFLNLTNLQTIDLSSNELVSLPGFTHNGIFVFAKNMTIYLGNNKITSISLKTISYNSSLDSISLSDNKISKLCSTVQQDKTKPHPYVIYDDILTPRTNENLMTWFRKNRNQVFHTDLPPGDENKYRQLTPSKLTQLNLKKNAIRLLSANCFADVTSIKTLVLSYNKITKIDALAFSGLVILKELDLSGNLIAAYERSVFSAAPLLDTLHLSNVGMTKFPAAAFINSNNIATLILNKNEMTNIPNLSTGNISILSSLKSLQMSYNKIDSLSDPAQDVYEDKDVCNITELNLDHNEITNLARNSFARFSLLSNLIITYNIIRIIDSAAFNGLHHLSNLDISYNTIGKLPDGAFSPLVSLKSLRISYAGLKDPLNPKAFINLNNLEDLCLDFNELKVIPHFIDNERRPIFLKLTKLSMSSNSFTTGKTSLNGLASIPTLQNITLNRNALTLRTGILEGLPNLRQLSLTKCPYVNIFIHGLKSRSLTRLRLTESQISIEFDTFEEAPMLRELNLENSKISQYSPRQQTFRNMAHLEIIDLSQSDILLNRNTFANSTKIKTLKLNGIRLQKLDRYMFQQMTNLRSLHLRDTGLLSLDYWSLPEDVRNNLKRIDLSKNPYTCDCGIIWFRRWLQTTNTTLVYSEEYKCQYPEKHRGSLILTLTDPSDLTCFKQPMDWISVSVVLFLFIFCISSLLVALLYRFRWHVRYWQSVIMTKHRQYKEMSDQRVYPYDAFVMYSQEDSHWVINKLRPHLETEEHLRLCIHQRDWLGGRDITDNITDSIENSRKCLLILSNAFAASQWCHFELTMAQSRLFQEDRDNLVLVMLEEISECYVTPRLRLQMQRQTYIEWTDNVMGQQLFWARLVRALRGPDQSVINSPLPQRAFVDINQHDNRYGE